MHFGFRFIGKFSKTLVPFAVSKKCSTKIPDAFRSDNENHCFAQLSDKFDLKCTALLATLCHEQNTEVLMKIIFSILKYAN